MLGILLLYVLFVAASTFGGLLIAIAGSQASRAAGSVAGVSWGVDPGTCVPFSFPSSDLLATP